MIISSGWFNIHITAGLYHLGGCYNPAPWGIIHLCIWRLVMPMTSAQSTSWVDNRNYRDWALRTTYQRVIMLPDIQLDDVIRLRKPHPCGSKDWIVVRIGADIGLKCLGCDRKILLSRREVVRRMKKRPPKDEENA